jgi:hypothetical protein
VDVKSLFQKSQRLLAAMHPPSCRRLAGPGHAKSQDWTQNLKDGRRRGKHYPRKRVADQDVEIVLVSLLIFGLRRYTRNIKKGNIG